MTARSIPQLILCLLMALPMLAQDTPSPTPVQADRPQQVLSDSGDRDDYMAYRAGLAEYKRLIDNKIAEMDGELGQEFRSLFGAQDLEWREQRRLAELRKKLSEIAAPDVVAALQSLRQNFAVSHQDVIHRLPRPEPRKLTEEQKTIVSEHHEVLQGAQGELNAILVAADGSGEYATLLALDVRSIEQQQQLSKLRRKLIGDSEDAQIKIRDIQELNTAFKEDHPGVDVVPQRLVRYRVQSIKRNVEAIHTLAEQIDTMLAETSEEYASLIEKEELSEEETARLAELRKKLIPETDAVDAFVRSIHYLRGSIREKKVRVAARSHHGFGDRGARSDADTVPARGAAGGASNQGTE